MNSNSPTTAVCAEAIRRTVSQLSRKLRPILRNQGISVAKLSVIGQIHRSGPLTPSELAAREGVRIQTLTRLLSELERGGWLLRSRHESDGRQSLLSLTAQGKKRLIEAARDQRGRLQHAIDATLSDGERSLLLRACTLLERLDAALGADSSLRAPVGAAT